jgi:hypothetical protein
MPHSGCTRRSQRRLRYSHRHVLGGQLLLWLLVLLRVGFGGHRGCLRERCEVSGRRVGDSPCMSTWRQAHVTVSIVFGHGEIRSGGLVRRRSMQFVRHARRPHAMKGRRLARLRCKVVLHRAVRVRVVPPGRSHARVVRPDAAIRRLTYQGRWCHRTRWCSGQVFGRR